MDTKKPTTKTKGKYKQVLTPIEKELLECARRGQPVLLYGKDTIGREDLIRKVHINNGGIDASWEHVEGGGQFKSEKDMVNEVQKTIQDHIKEYELLLIQNNWKTTSRTWIHVDCDVLNGEGVYEKLTYGYSYSILLMKYYYSDSLDAQDFLKGGSWFNWYPYVMRSGLLFINNLNCKLGDEEDTYYYKKLAIVIEKRKKNDPASGNWLVAYTYNPNDIPDQFRNQFVNISLDSEVKKIRKVKKDTFDDVKLEISVDSTDTPLFDAIVSANGVNKEKLPLESRYLEPLHLLAKTVKDDKNDGRVYNKDLDRTCNEGSNKAKYEIIKAFKKKIGKRAKGIIETKHSMGKRLLIPKKNIKFKPIS